jgi:DNA-binding transcriptional LysR family regulator
MRRPRHGQLEHFVAVARERHFARAAEACYVSQPALSASIAKLERELNVTLINRGHNYEGLTRRVNGLSDGPKGFSPNKKRSRLRWAAVQSGVNGTLRLGTEPTASTTQALPVAAFCAAHPLAKVHVASRLSTTELSRPLREFELVAAIAHFAAEDQAGLQVIPLYQERYIVLASADQLPTQELHHDMGGRRPAAACAIDTRHENSPDHRRGVRGKRVVVTPQVESDSVASLYAHVGVGSWATIVPHTWLRAMPVVGQARAVQLVAPDTTAQVSVATHAATPGSVVARAFMAAAQGLNLAEFFDQTLQIESLVA